MEENEDPTSWLQQQNCGEHSDGAHNKEDSAGGKVIYNSNIVDYTAIVHDKDPSSRKGVTNNPLKMSKMSSKTVKAEHEHGH